MNIESENTVPKRKAKADGFCGMCDDQVPATFPNKFYCCWQCADEARAYYRQFEGVNEE